MATTEKVAVIGAGGIGCDAACLLLSKGYQVVLYENGPAVGNNLRKWGHVRLFSPNQFNVSSRMLELLDQPPATTDHPTGLDLCQQVLEPLIKKMSEKYSNSFELKLNTEVCKVGRGKFRKTEAIAATGDNRRAEHPFRILHRNIETGAEAYDNDFKAVLDCSGSYGEKTANNFGVGGLPALGEKSLYESGRLLRTIPDAGGADKDKFIGKRVLIVGAGYSAATCIVALSSLSPGPTSVTWLTRTRKTEDGTPYKRIEGDSLPNRDMLVIKANDLASKKEGVLKHVSGSSVLEMSSIGNAYANGVRVTYEQDDESKTVDVDIVISLVGYKPDNSVYSEIQVHECYANQGPMKMAASLLAAAGAGGDCMSQVAPGADTLLNPEPNFFVLGSKSYGRSSLFLLRIGYEQIDMMHKFLPGPV